MTVNISISLQGMTTILTLTAMFGAIRHSVPKVGQNNLHLPLTASTTGQLRLLPGHLDGDLHRLCEPLHVRVRPGHLLQRERKREAQPDSGDASPGLAAALLPGFQHAVLAHRAQCLILQLLMNQL